MPLNWHNRSAKPAIVTLHARVSEHEHTVGTLTRGRADLRREEHDDVLALLPNLEHHPDELDIHFNRIAHIRANLDEIKSAWTNAKLRSYG
jgi:hypothetical protein